MIGRLVSSLGSLVAPPPVARRARGGPRPAPAAARAPRPRPSPRSPLPPPLAVGRRRGARRPGGAAGGGASAPRGRWPHVVVQQLVPAGERRSLDARLEPGRYRLRALALPHVLPVAVEPDGPDAAEATVGDDGWSREDLRLGERAALTLENATGDEQLF